MDFLTQPTSTPSELATDTKSLTSKPSNDDASLLTSSTDQKRSPPSTSDPFNQLRTAPLDSNGIKGEEKVIFPSIKNGDWRAFSRVEARVIVWQDGKLKKDAPGKKKEGLGEQVETEHVLVGVLWVTTDKRIFLIVDSQIPPRISTLTSPSLLKKYRRGSLSMTLTKTLSFGSSGGGSNSSPPATDNAVFEEEEGGEGEAAGAEGVAGKEKDKDGIKNAVKKLFNFGRGVKKEGQEEGEQDTALNRVKTKERSRSRSRGEKLSPVQSRGADLSGVGGVPSEQEKASPLPTHRNYTVTALLIPSFTHIVSHRYYPGPTVTRSTGSQSPPQLFSTSPLSSPPIDTQDAPRVELEVAKPVTTIGGNAEEADEGKARDVTVSFVFLDRFMAKEAEDFEHQLNESLDDRK